MDSEGRGYCPEWSVILKVEQLEIIYIFLCYVWFFIMLGTRYTYKKIDMLKAFIYFFFSQLEKIYGNVKLKDANTLPF